MQRDAQTFYTFFWLLIRIDEKYSINTVDCRQEICSNLTMLDCKVKLVRK